MRYIVVSCNLTALLLAATACGGDSSTTTCGDGTTLENGVCVAPPATECGAGTRLENGVCVADQPTTCGPGTVLQGSECVVDRTAPGPVTGLAAAISGSNINLDWTAGAMAAGTLVVRLKAGAEDAPAAGTTYTVGQTLPGGATVIAVGAGTTATDAFTVPGRYAYSAWSINASGNYGFGREVAITTAVPAQTATITVDVANTTAAVTAQPPNFQLAVSNVVYDAVNSIAWFDLEATNNTAGHYFNVKAVVHSASVGALDNATGTAVGGDPFVTLGFAAQLPGDVRGNTIRLNGIGATDTITLEVELVESGMAFLGYNAIDVAGGNAVELDLPGANGNGWGLANFTSGFTSPSSRYFYAVSRVDERVFRIDTTTGDVRSVAPFEFSVGNGVCLVRGPDGFAYAAFGLGRHRSSSLSGIGIAKLDPMSLTTLATAQLMFEGDERQRVHGCKMGTSRLAIGAGANVYLADIGTMTFIDTDTTSADVIDPVATTASELHGFAFANNGTTLYVTSSKEDLAIYALDTTTFAVSTYHTASSRVMSLTVADDGKLWWAADDGVYSFDGATEVKVPNLTSQMRAIATPRNGKVFAVTEESATYMLDVTDGSTSAVGELAVLDRSGHAPVLLELP
ncbi:MAG TPA: hypothetical protein VM513_29605 [Kofleriaceae bacterium]|nr:hypothetical protein [Kofleriaceae bacterium]